MWDLDYTFSEVEKFTLIGQVRFLKRARITT